MLSKNHSIPQQKNLSKNRIIYAHHNPNKKKKEKKYEDFIITTQDAISFHTTIYQWNLLSSNESKRQVHLF